MATFCQAIDSFCDGGLEPPQSIVDSLSSLSRELVDARRRISFDLHGAIRPLHSGLGFHLISNDLLLLVHLCLGDSHTPSHLTSLPQIRPVAHFGQGGEFPPLKPRIPVEISSDDEHKSSAVLLLLDEGEGDKENCLPAPLALLLDYIMSKFPVASKLLARPSNRLTDNIRLIMAAIRLQVSCNWTNRRATRRIVSLPPWRCCLATL